MTPPLLVPSMDNAIESLLLNPRKLAAIGVVSDEAAEFVSKGINLEQQQYMDIYIFI